MTFKALDGYRVLTRSITVVLTLLLAATVTVSCKRAADALPVVHNASSTEVSAPPAAATTKDVASVMIDSVNYMHERSAKYTLYDLSKTPPQAIGGAIVDRLGTGGEKGCCLALPKTWRPGMKVRLDWHESDRENIYEERTRELEIPRYTTPADLYVVFYPEHKVELVVSAAEPGHPDWQGQVKKTPWEQCVETYGRKPCKAALPKQFDTASSQGFCLYTQSKDFPKENFDGKTACETAMLECMKDFEDEPFCKGILWEPKKK